MKDNKTLTIFNFVRSNITGKIVNELAKTIKINKTLTHLSLGGNKINNEEGAQLLESLKKNYVITDFGIDCNQRIDDTKILTGIEERINHNKSLVENLSLLINQYFNNKTEDNAFKVLACTKFYQKADKELLKEYLTKQNIIDVKSTLNEVNNLITEKAFTVLSICKNIQIANFKAAVGKTHISALPNEVITYIGSYLIHNLWEKNVEVIGNIVEEIN